MGTIYSLWMGKRTPAFFALTKAELEDYYQNQSRVFNDAGGKGHLFCASGWANEQWGGWGLEEFPSVEAKINYSTGLYEIGHTRYVRSKAVLGVLMPGTEFNFEKAPFYRAYLLNFTEAWYKLSSQQQDEWLQKSGQTHAEFGSKNVILCNAHWATSEWMAWGVEAYPSLEAMIGRAAKLYEIGWTQFTEAVSLPGVVME